MWTLDDLKSDRDTQITAICIVFFLLAFPAYFSFAASGVDGAAGLGGVRDYEVSGELSYVELASGANTSLMEPHSISKTFTLTQLMAPMT